ncbi:hypothetical protein ACIBEJ_48265 [Nonomuraea sp. NPDC050790]|uniref:hypothetical protein n=1 Tax=Nonomuraea sp. NPDC050790 TaxID=3364371 RepID=UPI0037B2CF68
MKAVTWHGRREVRVKPAYEANRPGRVTRPVRFNRVRSALHLATVFGIDDKTAIRNANAARHLLESAAETSEPP